MVGSDGDEGAAARGCDDATGSQFGVDDDAVAVDLDRPCPQADGPIGRCRASQADGVVGRHATRRTVEPASRIRCIAAVQLAWQSSKVPMMPPLRTPSKAA